jgi:hypothetical protein
MIKEIASLPEKKNEGGKPPEPQQIIGSQRNDYNAQRNNQHREQWGPK